MRRLRKALAIGLVTGLLGALLVGTPLGVGFEERFGLAWLFWTRGPAAPPAAALVVSYDRDSSERLRLPAKVRDWPRGVHARLIDRLSAAGAAVIVLDLILDRATDPEEDQALAEAIAASGRVVLFEYLDRAVRSIPGAQPDAAGGQAIVALLETEGLRPPLPQFVDAAAGLAPFQLPRVPQRVSQFWAFEGGVEESATLPVVALQRYALAVDGSWRELMAVAGAGDQLAAEPMVAPGAATLERLIRERRLRFQQQPTLAARATTALERLAVAPAERQRLKALIAVYGGPNSHYLNFYGPPGQVVTIPLYQALDDTSALPDLTGRAVFVGQSDPMNLHDDMFPTVYSKRDGVDIAGVEIAATAFANLLDDRLLRQLARWQEALVLGLFGLAIGLIAGSLPALYAVPAVVALTGAIYATAQLAFTHAYVWSPVATPVLVQLPLGLFGGLLLQYLDARRAEANIIHGLSYYLPAEMARGFAAARVDPTSLRENVFAACLVTDASRFTTLAERLSPNALTDFLDQYFAILFGVAERHGGTVTDVVGDGMTCVWTAATVEQGCRARACRAALEIDAAIATLNQQRAPHVLPTRFGLHAGPVMVGNVGGSGHFVYSVVGDAVNTTARLESLNKQLGTRLLASAEVVAGLDGVHRRPLGRFRLVGKRQALDLVEILGGADEATTGPLLGPFAEALEHFAAEQLTAAAEGFEAVLASRPEDGPAAFYLSRCRAILAGAVPPQAGVIQLEQK